jgi:hypothetical protein
MGLKNVTYDDLKRMIEQVDVNKNGKVEFWEFLAIQLFISLELQDKVDLREFCFFLTQVYRGGMV